jgi:hypothetical protein
MYSLQYRRVNVQSKLHQAAGKYTATAGLIALVLTGLVVTAGSGRADRDRDDRDRDRDDERWKINQGYRVAPVPLNLVRKNRDLVGLGSYIVNVMSECNGCHSQEAATAYVGNPYLFDSPNRTSHQPKKINPETYLAGGRDFGPFPAPNSPLHIVTRNLTPDFSGKAVGGDSYSDFRETMRTGRDHDKLHPTCPDNEAQTANCVPYPFDGELLQIMPWPSYQDMSDRELRAIYEYLSAIPCIDKNIEGQPQLRHNCGR